MAKDKQKKESAEKEFISISIKTSAWDKIQDLKIHPKQRHGEIVEGLVDEAHSKRKK